MKLKNTKFKESSSKITTDKNVDYLFSYQENGKDYTISFTKQKTVLNRLDYEAYLAEFQNDFIEQYTPKKFFITDVKTTDTMVTTCAETYFKNQTILKITSEYPVDDSNAKTQLFDILENLRISSY